MQAMSGDRERRKNRPVQLATAVAIVATLLVAGCTDGGGSGNGDELTGEVRIAGSSTVFPVSQAMAEEFNREHPRVQVPVQKTGTGGGFENFFIPGGTDINDASRPIKDSELQNALDNGVKPVEFQVATDAITVVVNPEADWAKELTQEELRRIWRPDDPARRWSDVNPEWPDEEISLYGPTSASGTFDYFTEAIMGEEGASRSDYQGTEQDNTIVQAVAQDEYAIGYLGMAYYLENQDRVSAVAIHNGEEYVEPSLETAKAGDYRPLTRPLFIYVNMESLQRPAVEEFTRFYLERTDTSLISEIGYVPLDEEKKQENLDKLQKALDGDESVVTSP